jgi:hypothetical protein
VWKLRCEKAKSLQKIEGWKEHANENLFTKVVFHILSSDDEGILGSLPGL